MKRSVLSLFLAGILCLPALPAAAQDAAGANEAMGSLRVDRDPVLLSMAGAGFAMTSSNQAYAAFGNPAAAAISPKKLEAGVSYGSWAPKYAAGSQISAGVTGHVKKSVALSLGFSRTGYPGLDFEPASAFKPSDLVVRAGVGFAVSESFDLMARAGLGFAVSESFGIGFTAGYAKEALLSDYSLSAFSVSALAQYRIAGLNLAGGIVHLGGKVASAYPLPSSAKLAADYGFEFGNSNLHVALDGDYYFSGNYSVALGLNAGIGGIGFVRGGYRLASANAAIPSGLGLGAGFAWHGISLDVSFVTASETVGGSWMAGLGYRF